MLNLGGSISRPFFETPLDVSKYSMSFDGTTDYINFTETSIPIGTEGDDGSITFWAKRTDNNDEAVILGNSATGSYKRLYFDDDGDRLYIESDQNGQDAYAPVTADTNWHHYVITWVGAEGGSTATVKMYEDGSLLEVTNTNFGAQHDKFFTVNRIGDDNAAGDQAFKGLLYQVSIWTKALTASMVTQTYNSGTPIPLQEASKIGSSKITHLWRFAEGTGSTTEDSIGSLNGTIVNATWSSTTP